MDRRFRLQALMILVAFVLQGCALVQAPLLPDEGYPNEWGELLPLGPECKGVEGTYLNAGWVTDARKTPRPVSLMTVLALPGDAKAVSLSTRTLKVDKNGDAFITLQIAAHGETTVLHEREGCFCVKQTLVCTQVGEQYWSGPIGLGGSQRNVYFTLSRDRALTGKLQDCHADVVLIVPFFGIDESWVRFMNVGD